MKGCDELFRLIKKLKTGVKVVSASLQRHLLICTLLVSNFHFYHTQLRSCVFAKFHTKDVFSDFDANSILSSSHTQQSDSCSALQSLHFCMCTNWGCYRSAESDSTETSWLGGHTAVCADSTSCWRRNKSYLHPFVLALPNPRPNALTVSVCGQTRERKWHLYLSPSPSLSPFLILIFSWGSCWFPWHSHTVQPASSHESKKTLSLSLLLSYLAAPSPFSLLRSVALKLALDYFNLLLLMVGGLYSLQ